MSEKTLGQIAHSAFWQENANLESSWEHAAQAVADHVLDQESKVGMRYAAEMERLKDEIKTLNAQLIGSQKTAEFQASQRYAADQECKKLKTELEQLVESVRCRESAMKALDKRLEMIIRENDDLKARLSLYANSITCNKQTDKDNPSLDGTDNAHPAWWRGHDAGVDGTVQRVLMMLDGKDDGAGTARCKEYQDMRKRILVLIHEARPSPIQQCASCGNEKATPYRRDDLGGYVCSRCVEDYLNKTLDELESVKTEAKLMADTASKRWNDRIIFQKTVDDLNEQIVELQEQQHPATKFKVGDEVFFGREEGGLQKMKIICVHVYETSVSYSTYHSDDIFDECALMTRSEAADWVMKGGKV